MTLALVALSLVSLAGGAVDAAACTSCHRESLDAARARGVVHAPFEKASCGECHRAAHGDPPRDALLLPEPELCTRCHEEPRHRIVHRLRLAKRGQCTPCHAHHSADRKGLLEVPDAEACAHCHKDLSNMHDGYAVEGARCWACHLAHSRSGAKLMPATVHPVLSGCGSCHGERGTDRQFARTQEEPELCLACHEDQAKALKRRVVHAAVQDGGCTACHSPHASPREALLSADEEELCLGCHAELEAKLGKKIVHAAVKDGGCGGCHEPHAADRPKLLRASGAAACTGCHPGAEEWAASKGAVHAPVKRGECQGCHEPHGGDQPKLLVREARALCLSCHSALEERLAAAGAVVHAPVAEGCGDCHAPHAAAEAALLREAVPGLCTGCHSVDGAETLKKHGGLAFGTSRCTGCHDPHAGGAKGIVRAVGHMPATDGMCDACHETADRPIAAKLKEGGMGLCADCHDFAAIQGLRNAHQAVRDGDCFACHAPHAAANPHLLARAVPRLCVDCHGPPDAKVRAHARLTADSDCSRCHAPHAPKAAARPVAAAPEKAPVGPRKAGRKPARSAR